MAGLKENLYDWQPIIRCYVCGIKVPDSGHLISLTDFVGCPLGHVTPAISAERTNAYE